MNAQAPTAPDLDQAINSAPLQSDPDREYRLKALPLVKHELAPMRRLLPAGTIQGEWDNTIKRLCEICELLEYNEKVSELQFAYVVIRKTETLDIDAVERILFDNLLLAMWSRTEKLNGVIHIGGEWLGYWRKAVSWKVEKVGHINRLVPWQPQHQWTYRYNLMDAEF